MNYMGIREVKALTKLSRSRIEQLLREEGSDFPRPMHHAPGGRRLWIMEEIFAWHEKRQQLRRWTPGHQERKS